MTVVSSKEFASRPTKYYNLAQNEQVVIKRGKNEFYLMYKPLSVETYPEQPILEPDDNLRRAITADELLSRIHKDIHDKFENRLYRK